MSERNGHVKPPVARRAHAAIARERRRTYEASRANGIEPVELVRLAEERAGVAPVRDLPRRDFVQEAREELADCRNYLVWLAAQVDHWAHLAPHLAVALRAHIGIALGVVAQLFEHVEQLRVMMVDFRSATA